MESRYHFLVSGLLAFIYVIFVQDYLIGLLIMTFGWLIDADHEVDYYLAHGRFVLNPIHLASELSKKPKFELGLFPLHSLELSIGLIYFTPFLIWLAYILHLFMDYLYDICYPTLISLSLIYRLKNYRSISNTKKIVQG